MTEPVDPTRRFDDTAPPWTRAYSDQPPPPNGWMVPAPDPHVDDSGSPTPVLSPPPTLAFNPGIDTRRYIGSAIGSMVGLALLCGGGAWLIGTVYEHVVPASYWIHVGVTPAPISWPWAAAVGGAAAVLAAGLMWILLIGTANAGVLFTVIVGAITVLAVAITWFTHPWQLAIGPALLVAAAGWSMWTLTVGYAANTILRPGASS